jgi:hypothetical protein
LAVSIPIRPKPFMPTLTATLSPISGLLVYTLIVPNRPIF